MQIIKGKEKILTAYSAYLQDESMLSAGEIEYLAFPETESQVVEFMKFATKENIPVTISNGRTGVVGGAIPNRGALISVEKLNKILELKKVENEYRLVVQAGVSLSEITNYLETHSFPEGKYFYPVNVTEQSARIGGNVATNASGERSYRYGPTRNWVRRIKVVLSTGDVVEINRGEIFAKNNEFELEFTDGKKTKIKIPNYKIPEIKNAAGYYSKPNMDLIDLFIGSEGTLGVITEVEVALLKKPENIMSLLAFFPTELAALNFFLSAKVKLTDAIVFEYFDSAAFEILNDKRKREGSGSVVPEFPKNANSGIFFELIFTEETLDETYKIVEKLLKENNSSIDNTWGGFEQKEIEKIHKIRHALPEGINETIAARKRQFPNLHKISVDIAVPEEKLLDMINYYVTVLEPLKLQYTLFGHIGESHLHMNILPRDETEFIKSKELHLVFARKAVEFGGTVSAEHGIGKIKHKYLEVMYGIDGLKQMAEVKKSFDPKCILNRGNIFPEELLELQ